MGYSYNVTFNKVTHGPVRRSLKCRNCGKRFTRSRTFWQTINPCNKLPDGTQKNRVVIGEELRAEAQAWHPDNLCGKCEDEDDRNTGSDFSG